MAEREGWRLHLVATSRCRASVVIGDPPNPLEVSLDRTVGGAWTVPIDGLVPPLTLQAAGGERVGMSLLADGAGTVRVRVGDEDRGAGSIDRGRPAPAPPYSLAFTGDSNGRGCAIVWLEIPVPFQPGRVPGLN
jgi:hypothetical protein